MTRRYQPGTHDELLTRLNTEWLLSDAEIANRIQLSIVEVKENRRRLGLPGRQRLDREHFVADRYIAPPKEKPNPIAVAMIYLQGRLVEKPDGYYLDGRPAKLLDIMRACNRVRVGMELPQIEINPLWRVEP